MKKIRYAGYTPIKRKMRHENSEAVLPLIGELFRRGADSVTIASLLRRKGWQVTSAGVANALIRVRTPAEDRLAEAMARDGQRMQALAHFGRI